MKKLDRLLSDLKSLAHRQIYGVPSGIMSTASFIKKHPQGWQGSIDAQTRPRTAPVQHGAIRVDFAPLLPPIPALGIFRLPRGFLYGSQGWAFTSDRFFLRDCSWFGESADSLLLPPQLRRPTSLSGACLSLSTDFARFNFGHYVLDSLSRIEIFKRAGGSFDDVDHILIAKPPSDTARLALEATGIPMGKVRWSEDDVWTTADTVIATSFPGLKRNYPNWLGASLQQYFAPVLTSGRKIYVPRAGVRKITNEAELIRIATEFGFEAFDFKTCAHEPDFFASASAVVGAHGASLANLAFCRPGTKVLEMIPSDHVYPYYYSLAEAGGLDYHCLVGNSLAMRPPNTFGPSEVDFTIDPAEFRSALAAMG
jgi:hypothetical protein